MEKNVKTRLFFFIAVVIVFFSGIMAYEFQTNFGTIDIQEVAITHSDGTKIVGKLFRPIDVDDTNPAPGILGIHGYNNDKDVQRGTALELARAGFVVLTIDQIGHGDSEGLFTTTTQIQGASTAYVWLARQSFVDGGMGVYGHSMGYVSAFYFPLYGFPADVYAPNASIFETFPPSLQNFFVHRNVLHLWAEYEEWYTVDLTIVGPNNITADMTVDEVIEQGLIVAGINAGLGPGVPGEVDTTYGDFSVGNAYREHLARGVTHPGLTMDLGCQQESVAWMLQALKGYNESEAWNAVAALGQFYLGGEIFSGIALLFSFISMIFLYQWLMSRKYFSEVAQPMPTRVSMITTKKWLWWTVAAVNAAIAGVVYIFFTHTDLDWGFQTSPSSPLVMGMMNNFLGFYLICAAIAGALVIVWALISHYTGRDRIKLYDLAATYGEDSFVKNLKSKSYWRIFGKTLLIVMILFFWLYLLVSIFQTWFMIEFRIFWSFMKMFTIERFWIFLLYLPIFLPFFLINGGVFLFAEIRQKEASSPNKTQIIWTIKACFAMLTGLLVVFLIQYLGPVFRANYIFEGWDFNPIMPLQLMGVIPLSVLIYFLMVYFFRKTGKIYLGSIFATVITVWFLTTATVVGSSL